MSYFLSKEDIEDICWYTKENLSYDEPVPSFETSYINKLESALVAPQISIDGKTVYSTLAQQAAVLFYEMIKLHPFLNGNKRIACVSLLVFLSLNSHWLQIPWKKLYEISVEVAKSEVRERKKIINSLANFFERHISTA